jgi:hypothetical protein
MYISFVLWGFNNLLRNILIIKI